MSEQKASAAPYSEPVESLQCNDEKKTGCPFTLKDASFPTDCDISNKNDCPQRTGSDGGGDETGDDENRPGRGKKTTRSEDDSGCNKRKTACDKKKTLCDGKDAVESDKATGDCV